MISMTRIFLAFAFLTCFLATAHAQYQTHSFQYLTSTLTTASPTGSSVSAFNSVDPPKWYSLYVTTAATGYVVKLEGSLDNVTFSDIAITNTGLGMISNVDPKPALYFRVRASTIPANTTITATAIGTW